MTKRIYKTAQGKTIDLGALILQNENTRAVGNMNVNTRGDLVDSTNQPIDKKNRQVQRQYQQSSVPAAPPQSYPMKSEAKPTAVVEEKVQKIIQKTNTNDSQQPQTGLAGALARSRATKK